MKLAVLLLFMSAFFSVINSQAQNDNGILDDVTELAEKRTIPFTMPDGTELMTDVYLPVFRDSIITTFELSGYEASLEIFQKGTQYILYDSINGSVNEEPYSLPVIFIRTPYDKNTEGIGYLFAFMGYAVIIQDNRGCYASQGVYLPMYSDAWSKEPYHPDIHHTLDPAVNMDVKDANSHEDGYNSLQIIINELQREYKGKTFLTCNGNIGMLGPSALGNVQYQLASVHQTNPQGRGLKCLLPIVSTNEHYRFTAVQNGVFREQLVTGWVSTQYKNLLIEGTENDNSIFNDIHSPADFGFDTKDKVAETAIDFWISQKHEGSLPGYYPNSVMRSDLDASFAPVDNQGTGSTNGSYSRYLNMEVPGYHLTGWWDIFIEGQIETYNNLMDNLSDTYDNKQRQKLIIGPWAHQTVTQRKTGDITYPENVQDFVLDVLSVEEEIEDIPLGDLAGSEIIQWFRSNLLYNNWKKTGDPKIVFPKSEKWQAIIPGVTVRVPAEDYIIPFEKFINFMAGRDSLTDIIFESSLLGSVIKDTISVPAPEEPMIEIDEIDNINRIDFTEIPNIRLYVAGPVDDGISYNQHAGNYWLATDSFPFSKGISYQPLFLKNDNTLSAEEPETSGQFLSYVHDPKNPVYTLGGANMITPTPQRDRKSQGQINLAVPELRPYCLDREDVLQFETNPLEDTLSIIGFPKATIYAKSEPVETLTDSTNIDFMVRIIDVYPDGGEYFVVEGVVNARARDYARKIAQGAEDPDIPFTNIVSGETYEYVFKMMPIAYTFGKDHRIKILISSSNHPRYQSNPNIPLNYGEFFRWKPGDTTSYVYDNQRMYPRKAMQTIYMDTDHPSHVSLPVFDGQIAVSVKDNIKTYLSENQTVQMFPNPSADIVFINSLYENNTVKINNMQGAVVMEKQFRQSVQISVMNWPAGIYIVNVFNHQHRTSEHHKLVVKK